MNGARRRTDRSDRNRRGGIGLNLHLRLTHRYPCPASYVHAEISAIIYSRRARGHTRHTTRGPHEGSATPPARLPTAHDRPRTTRARTIYAENSVRAQLHNVVLRWPYDVYPDSSRRKYGREYERLPRHGFFRFDACRPRAEPADSNNCLRHLSFDNERKKNSKPKYFYFVRLKIFQLVSVLM